MVNLFVYGVLRDQRIRRILLGRTVSYYEGLLFNYVIRQIEGEVYPGIVTREDYLGVPEDPANIIAVQGHVLTGIGDKDLNILDKFEGEEYKRKKVLVNPWISRTGEFNPRKRKASVYVFQQPELLSETEWDIREFQQRHLEDHVRKCERFIRTLDTSK